MEPDTLTATTDAAATAAESATAIADWTQFAIDTSLAYGTKVLLAVLILVIGWIVAGWVRRLIGSASDRAKLDVALSRFLSQIGRYAVLVMTVIATLATVGIQTTSFVAVLASVGFAIGMALQGTLGHLASGVMLLVFRPFTLGNLVNAGGSFGVVQDIGLFATVLLTPNNETVIVPNGAVTGATITNYTTQGTLRAIVDVGVAYGADHKKVEQICLAAAASVDEVLSEPAPGFAFTEMAASSINFALMPWSTTADYLTMQHKVRCAVYDALNAEGIEIPFDQVVMHQAPTES
ncbi:MAG: small conductance mechanosensitive channel [Kiritimatiellia bacterium]|jgi:small conductance mechanosensitive channel